FNDRRTPDLQFDHVVFSSGRSASKPADVGATDAALATGNLWFLGEPDETGEGVPTMPGHRGGRDLLTGSFPELELPDEELTGGRRRSLPGVVVELRHEHYNATITHFEPTH